MSDLAQQAADLFGVTLTAEQVTAFEVYARELVAWNTHMNLTAITAPEEVRVRHFLDSLSIVPFKPDARIIDVGTGAGFPGLPLAIAYPDAQVMLMDSTGKKVTFLDHVVTTLGLKNVRTLHARAEEAGHLPDQRSQYDLVVARAVARLPALVEYLLPFARVGGLCVAMKGDTAHQEADDAQNALRLFGGRVQRIDTVQLPGVEQTHYLVMVEKTDATPAAYPRKPGIPTRKPL